MLCWFADGAGGHRADGNRRLGERFRGVLGQGERERDAGNFLILEAQ